MVDIDPISGFITLIFSLVLGILNMGDSILVPLASQPRAKRAAVDDSYSGLSSCPFGYSCRSRLSCQQSGSFSLVQRSIISLTSCPSDGQSNEAYVCCPSSKQPGQIMVGSYSGSSDQSVSALNMAKDMGDRMLRIMLNKNTNQQPSKSISSQSTSDIIDDGFMDEIMKSLENIKSKR